MTTSSANRPIKLGLVVSFLLTIAIPQSLASGELMPEEIALIDRCHADLDEMHKQWLEILPSDTEIWEANKTEVCESDARVVDGQFKNAAMGPMPLVQSVPVCDGCASSIDIFCFEGTSTGEPLDGKRVMVTEWNAGTAMSERHKYVPHEELFLSVVQEQGASVVVLPGPPEMFLPEQTECVAAFVTSP